MFYKYFPYKNMQHRTILLYGFHVSFFFVFLISSITDLMMKSYLSFIIDFTSTILTVVSFYLLHIKKKILLSKFFITFLTVVPILFLIYVNHSSHLDFIYIILLPLVSFYLYNLRDALIMNFIIYALVIALYSYIHIINPLDILTSNDFGIMNMFLATLLIMFFGLFYHFGIESSLMQLRSSNKQKDLLLQEVHHRVKNNLNITASILALQAEKESGVVKLHLLKSKSRIEAIATVHEMLYRHDNFEEINFYDYILKMESALFYSLGNKEHSFYINISHNLFLPLNMMIQLGLIVNELIINSIKHVKNEILLKINISLNLQKGTYQLLYSDNGVCDIDVATLGKQHGLGLTLIELCAKQLKGESTFSCQSGLSYKLEFRDE